MGKKITVIVAIIVVLFGALYLVVNQKNTNKISSEDNPYGDMELRQSTIDQIGDPNYANVILPDELDKQLGEEGALTVYFFSPECVWCVKATPELVAAAKEVGVDVKQYNLLEFNEGYTNFGIEGTPTLIHFENGEEVAREFGAKSKEEYIAFFEEYSKN